MLSNALGIKAEKAGLLKDRSTPAGAIFSLSARSQANMMRMVATDPTIFRISRAVSMPTISVIFRSRRTGTSPLRVWRCAGADILGFQTVAVQKNPRVLAGESISFCACAYRSVPSLEHNVPRNGCTQRESEWIRIPSGRRLKARHCGPARSPGRYPSRNTVQDDFIIALTIHRCNLTWAFSGCFLLLFYRINVRRSCIYESIYCYLSRNDDQLGHAVFGFPA